MAASILFVHGTGVRAAGLAATMALLRQQAVDFLPDWKFEACAWGDAFGAALNRSGASMHGYQATGDAAQALAAQQRARWVLLADDPLIELRFTPAQAYLGAVPGLGIWARLPALRSFAPALAEFPEPELRQAWVDLIAETELDPAWAAVVKGLTLSAAAASPLVARALVAALQARLRDLALPALGVARRDALVGLLQPALGGPPAAVLDWLLGKLTAYGRDQRGRIGDLSTPAVGDILRYQARGEAVRGLIGDEVQRTGARVLLAHSLGGIAAVDWLALAARPIDVLITVGSQAAYFYEIDALVSRAQGAGLPAFFPQRWLNVYDPSDMLGYPAGGVFRGQVTDLVVDNGEPFPEAHSAYFHNRQQFWPALADYLKGA